MQRLSAAPIQPPPMLPGFEHINRFWDRGRQLYLAKILPGEFYVTVEQELIGTVLGSCISACIRDPVFGIGGMNHFMLPTGGDEHRSDRWQGTHLSAATRYGTHAMEQLINTLIKHGARRDNLEVKIFGGGRVLKQMTDVGRRNIEFAREYIATEGLRLVSEDVGDIHPRKIMYWPLTGRVLMKKLRSLHNDTILLREENYQHSIEERPTEGAVELF
ncbi:MAG TPA: chemoreceptor glutamine deamidase CheD [Gammaproteobacteria bacterium]